MALTSFPLHSGSDNFAFLSQFCLKGPLCSMLNSSPIQATRALPYERQEACFSDSALQKEAKSRTLFFSLYIFLFLLSLSLCICIRIYA